MTLRRFLPGLAVFLACSAPLTARAQDASKKAAAETLFQEGRKLLDAGNYPSACQKFLASEKLDPAPGTLLNLAGCYEKNGQTASAWATFKEAAAASHQKGRNDWEDLARQRATNLEPTLSRLTITVTAKNAAGMTVKRNDVVVVDAELGTAIPLDPGTYDVTAEQAGRVGFHQSVDVKGAGATATVTIPDLDEAKGPGIVCPVGPDFHRGRTQRIVGLVVAGVGVVGLGIGAAFGLVAMNKENDATSHDCTGNFCNAQGVQLGKDAHSAATASTIAFTVGAVAAAAGITVYFLAPKPDKEPDPSMALRVTAAPGGGTFGVVGAW